MFTRACIITVLLVSLVFILGGCNAEKKTAMPQTFSNVNVVTANSSAAQFPAGSKYAFVKFAADSDENGEIAMIDQRLQNAISDELKKKGYRLGEYSDIKFFVAYTFGLQQEIDVLVGKSKIQGNEWIAAVITPQNYVNGALMVQIIDAKSMEPVWLGVLNADVKLTSVSEKAKRERVAYAAKELLTNFPPK